MNRKKHTEMKANAMSVLNGQSMTAVNVLTQLIRLHQITCGHMKTDALKYLDLKSNRLDELMQILGETSGKVIIWANYIHDIEAIEKIALRKNLVMIHAMHLLRRNSDGRQTEMHQ